MGVWGFLGGEWVSGLTPVVEGGRLLSLGRLWGPGMSFAVGRLGWSWSHGVMHIKFFPVDSYSSIRRAERRGPKPSAVGGLISDLKMISAYYSAAEWDVGSLSDKV